MPKPDPDRQNQLRRATDIAIRLGTLTLLASWCFVIVSPFLLPIAWGVIIAIAMYGPFATLSDRLGNRPRLAATLIVTALLLLVIVPSVLITGSLANDIDGIAQAVRAGELRIPSPSERVAHWPVIGERAYTYWLLASQNLGAALADMGPRLQGLASWLLGTLAQFGLGILQFIFSTVISGIVLASYQTGATTVTALASRLSGTRGPALVNLAAATVRGVTRGILGVALIQTIMAGAALFLAGVPGAALWSVLALILSVVQIGVAVIMVPATIWLFAHADNSVAIAFAVWTALLMPIDNILKPILMGRGLSVPMSVVFIGAIGGFMTQGIIGLFVGAVVLVLGYELCRAWLDGDTEATPDVLTKPSTD